MEKTSSPLRICVERITQPDRQHLNELKTISSTENQFSKLRAAFLTAKLWPKNSTINVAFLAEPVDVERTSVSKIEFLHKDKIDPLQKKVEDMSIIEAVKLIVKERIEPICDLKFVFVTDPTKAQVRITFDTDKGAWSLVGTDCLNEKDYTKATMNLGWFDVATTIHEFGHTLGMVHEHQNPQGNKIDWDDEKVYKWAEKTQGWNKETTYKNIIEKYQADQINGSEYDPDSIMLYFFPASLTKNDKGTEENVRLSRFDVEYINMNYPNSPLTPVEFYKKTYNETLVPSITSKPLNSMKPTQNQVQKSSQKNDLASQIVGGILIGLVIFIVIYVCVKYLLPDRRKITR